MGLQSDILAGSPPRVQPANGHQLRLRGFRIQKTFQNLRQCQSKLGSALDCLGMSESFCELFLHLSMLKRSRAPARETAAQLQNIKRKANAQFLHITYKKIGHLWGRHDALLDDFPYQVFRQQWIATNPVLKGSNPHRIHDRLRGHVDRQV